MKKLLFKTVLITAMVVMAIMTSCVSQKKVLYLHVGSKKVCTRFC